MGVNEDATIAYQLGQNGPQERNNADNFKILADYCRRFQKVGLLDVPKNCGKRELNGVDIFLIRRPLPIKTS